MGKKNPVFLFAHSSLFPLSRGIGAGNCPAPPGPGFSGRGETLPPFHPRSPENRSGLGGRTRGGGSGPSGNERLFFHWGGPHTGGGGAGRKGEGNGGVFGGGGSHSISAFRFIPQAIFFTGSMKKGPAVFSRFEGGGGGGGKGGDGALVFLLPWRIDFWGPAGFFFRVIFSGGPRFVHSGRLPRSFGGNTSTIPDSMGGPWGGFFFFPHWAHRAGGGGAPWGACTFFLFCP